MTRSGEESEDRPGRGSGPAAATAWLGVITVAAVWWLPRLLQRGMFVDGVTYASVARNLSVGLGRPWSLHYTETLWPVFHRQPPLAFWIQSALFRLFGDSVVVERAYSIGLGAATAALIALLWRRVFASNPALARAAWWPVLLWLAFPRVRWAYTNNVLENTLGVFALAAVIACITALRARRAWAGALVAAAAISGAVLAKGVPGLFPLLVPLWATATLPAIPRRRAAVVTAVAVAGVVTVAAALAACPPAHDSFVAYAGEHLLPGVSGVGSELDPGTQRRVLFVLRLLRTLAVPSVVALAVLLLRRRRAAAGVSWTPRGPALFFGGIALAASLPLLLSAKLRGFYVVPSLPYFALAIAAATAGAVVSRHATNSPAPGSRQRAWRAALAIVLVGTVAYAVSWKGTAARDADLLADIDAIGAVVPAGTIVGFDGSLREHLALVASLQRHHRISLDPGGLHRELVIRPRGSAEAMPPAGMRPVAAGEGYELYRFGSSLELQ